jgi:hypothetical protein
MRRFKAEHKEPDYWLCCKCGNVFVTDLKYPRKRCSECGYWMRHISEAMLEKIRYNIHKGE